MRDEALLDVHQAAHLLNIHERKVYALAKKGKIPLLRVGASLRFSRTHLLEWFAQPVSGNEQLEKEVQHLDTH